ncbi:hypothetical protein ACFV0T_41555 [Streptomyces sp. NPDC059582]|uniref:hypothetical protein n=1 Tax=Streptomyces sp. NPDC059582 TaxID=3346875 RepID=UPI0036C179B6
MVHLLETLLPEGKFSAQRGQGQERGDKPGPPPSAELVFERDGRAAKVRVALTWYPVPIPDQFTQCPDSAYNPYSQCTQHTLPGGVRVVLDRSPEHEGNPSGAKLYSALVTYKDGKQVLVSQSGSTNEEGDNAEVREASYPLTLEQLSEIAISTVWKPVLSAMPEPPSGGPRTGSVSRMTGQQISHLIEQLLPPGLQAAQADGSAGFGHLTVDDGHGKSLVAVNVQRWKPDDATMAQLFKKADMLPDGTLVSIRKGPALKGGKGAIQWSVDTLRKDGLRVVISAVNARAYRLPASRSEPALDIQQLQGIALDTAWERASR